MLRVRARAVGDAEAFDLAAAQVDDVEALLVRGLVEVDDADPVARGDLVLVERGLGLGEQVSGRSRPAR